MRVRTNQSGSSAVELALLVIVIAILGLVGYKVYQRQHSKSPATTTASSQPANAGNVASAPQITNTSDLDKASTTLDQTDPSSSNDADTNQMNAQLAGF